MKIISHRCNLYGPNPELENKPEYILAAIKCNFRVEIDLWVIGDNDELYLGHDEPQYKITIEFFNKMSPDMLLVHCKNPKALSYITELNPILKLEIFTHRSDEYSFTSTGKLLIYPHAKTLLDGAILMIPEKYERHNQCHITDLDVKLGVICTDYPFDYLKNFQIK